MKIENLALLISSTILILKGQSVSTENAPFPLFAI